MSLALLERKKIHTNKLNNPSNDCTMMMSLISKHKMLKYVLKYCKYDAIYEQV